jgi:hypothetical protein
VGTIARNEYLDQTEFEVSMLKRIVGMNVNSIEVHLRGF